MAGHNRSVIGIYSTTSAAKIVARRRSMPVPPGLGDYILKGSKSTRSKVVKMSSFGYVWTAPAWQGLI
jgi:hypothetical protein